MSNQNSERKESNLYLIKKKIYKMLCIIVFLFYVGELVNRQLL